ncbi:MAG TPA: pectinesterase family protein [Acidobacteriaceae bacterium]
MIASLADLNPGVRVQGAARKLHPEAGIQSAANRRHCAVWMLALLLLAATSRALPQDNLITGEPINGYTGVPFDTRAYAYDYLVDSSLPADDPANRKFRTLQAAYQAAPEGTPAKPIVIGIKPDVYFVHGTMTTPGLAIKKNYLTLLGLTDDRRKVVLADNRGHMEGATDNGYMITVDSIGFTAMNLTFINYCNTDYEYPGDPSKNLTMRSPLDAQAVAMSMRGDKQVFSHVAFLGLHDTIYLQTLRSYFTHVYVEGNEDFLGIGSGLVSVWEDSEVYFPTGSGIMFAPGVVFINTVFKASHGLSFYKPFNTPTALIHCVLPVNTPQSPVSWMLEKTPKELSFYSLTYRTKDAKGNPAVVFDSNVGPPTFTHSRELSDQEAAAFNPWNLLRATPTGVVDDWDPAGAKAKYASQGSLPFRMVLGPNSVAAARGYPGNQQPYSEAGITQTVRAGGPVLSLNAVVLPLRVQDEPVAWSTSSSAITLDETAGTSVHVTARNDTDHTEHATVKAVASNGFFSTIQLDVEPSQLPPPAFKTAAAPPVVENREAAIRYSLDLGGHDDHSLITWYLCDDAQCAARRKVAVSRGEQPLRQYKLGVGAVGKYVAAEVQPKSERSDLGAAVTAISVKPVTGQEVAAATVSPNFRNFVEAPNDQYVSGMWTVLGNWQIVTNDNLVYWKSTTGDDLANGYGLRVNTQGGSLLYQNDQPVGDMQVKVVMIPEKTVSEGFGYQGFGSPGSSADEGSQRAEIFIKYDPRTRTGYSLRFWHTLESASTCMFQLFRIDNGKGSSISPLQQLTGVFKPNTTFILSIVGSTFTARAANTMDSDTLSLQGTITPNHFGGAGAYWSGTVRLGNSAIISQFEIAYPGVTR